MTCSAEALADEEDGAAAGPTLVVEPQSFEAVPDATPPDATPPNASAARGDSRLPAAENRDWLAGLRPAKVSVTAGALFPLFLIYEYPAPWAGVEVAWQTGSHAQLVANAGTSMIWIRGSQRSFFPLGLSVRVFPWERGPWLQFGLGTMPYVEHVGLELPERSASTVDVGAAMAAKLGVGVRIRNWNIGLGSDFNLGDFYDNYTGTETRPWEYTFMAWVGVPVWKRSAP